MFALVYGFLASILFVPVVVILFYRFISTKKISNNKLFFLTFIIIFIALTVFNIIDKIHLYCKLQEFDLNLDGVIDGTEKNSAVSNNKRFSYMREDAILFQMWISIFSFFYTVTCVFIYSTARAICYYICMPRSIHVQLSKSDRH